MVRINHDIKTKMSFTDLIPATFNKKGITDKVTALDDFLFRPGETDDAIKVNEVFESIDFLITMIRNPVISLFINPQSITVSKQILLSKQQTRGGFVVQFWGHDLETIQVQAETGYFGLSNVPLRAFNMFKDYCYQGRYNKRKPFKAIPLMTMIYENQALRGYFNNLSYTVVQSRPYIITYNFTFTVVELVSIPIITSISRIVDRLAGKPYQTIDDIRKASQFGRGWGVKLY